VSSAKNFPLRTWAALLAVVVLLWDSVALWPVRVLIVMFHELSHAGAAWLTGGRVLEIGLTANEGGHTLTQGGSRFLILNAGYLGSLAFGMALLATAKSPHIARGVTATLGLSLLTITLGYVRPFLSFGFIYSAAAAATLTAIGLKTTTETCRFTLRFLGLTSVMYALFDIRSDVFRLDGVQTDATMLAAETGIPSIAWGIGWLSISAIALWRARSKLF